MYRARKLAALKASRLYVARKARWSDKTVAGLAALTVLSDAAHALAHHINPLPFADADDDGEEDEAADDGPEIDSAGAVGAGFEDGDGGGSASSSSSGRSGETRDGGGSRASGGGAADDAGLEDVVDAYLDFSQPTGPEATGKDEALAEAEEAVLGSAATSTVSGASSGGTEFASPLGKRPTSSRPMKRFWEVLHCWLPEARRAACNARFSAATVNTLLRSLSGHARQRTALVVGGGLLVHPTLVAQLSPLAAGAGAVMDGVTTACNHRMEQSSLVTQRWGALFGVIEGGLEEERLCSHAGLLNIGNS